MNTAFDVVEKLSCELELDRPHLEVLRELIGDLMVAMVADVAETERLRRDLIATRVERDRARAWVEDRIEGGFSSLGDALADEPREP